MSKPNVWDKAAKLKVWRTSPLPGNPKPELLEPGVNYFVLSLEQLGVRTTFSCQGHPEGFYIAFYAPYEVALRIEQCELWPVKRPATLLLGGSK